MNPRWHWQTQGKMHAPISTHELDRLIRQNRISDADQLRLVGSDDWMSAADVKVLFADPINSALPGTTSESAARLLSHSPPTALERPSESGALSTALADIGHQCGSGLSTVRGTVGDWLGTAGEQLSRLATLFGRKTALVMLAIVLLAILVKDFEFEDTLTQDAVEQFAATFGQIQALQQREASGPEWKQFEQETLAWLQPAINELEVAANRHPIEGQYWTDAGVDAARAGRETYFAAVTLRRLLQRGQAGDPELESSFLKCMGEVRLILTGEVAVRRREFQRRTTPREPEDPLLTRILVLDGIVVVGAAFWWWRRRQSQLV